jgi:cytochrome P450
MPPTDGPTQADVGRGAPRGRAAFNPQLPEYRTDPHPALPRLRAEDPVHFSPVLGVWVLTRYADCLAALHDQRISADARHWANYEKFFFRHKLGAASPPAEAYRHWLLQMDAPDHTRLRTLVAKAFVPRLVEALRPRILRLVNDLLDRAAPRGRMDVVADLAYPLPINVISEMLGIPAADHAMIRDWSSALLPSFSPAMSVEAVEEVNRAMGEFTAYFRALAAERRRAPRDDLLSALIQAREEDDRLSEGELEATCVLLAFAGHATTVQLIAGGWQALLEHPDQLTLLRRDPARMDAAIEEALRHVSPLQLVYRTTREPVAFGERTIEANQMVFVSLAAANRDPAEFADPDRFDISRENNRHIAFGHGGHFCLGAALARLEVRVAWRALLDRFPRMALAGETPRRETSLLLRGIQSLEVTF